MVGCEQRLMKHKSTNVVSVKGSKVKIMSLSADHCQHEALRKTQNQLCKRDPPHQKIKSPTIDHDGPKYFTTHMHSDGQRTMVNTRILSECVTVKFVRQIHWSFLANWLNFGTQFQAIAALSLINAFLKSAVKTRVTGLQYSTKT